MARAVFFAALLAFCAVVRAQEAIGLVLQFDNRGSKVSDPKKAAQIVAAVADCICNVPIGQVKYQGTIGQSTLFNHQSVSNFQCEGPTKNNVPLLKTCESNIKSGWVSSSNAKKCVRKYTNTWAVGDSVSVQKAVCSAVKVASMNGRAQTSKPAPSAPSATARPAVSMPAGMPAMPAMPAMPGMGNTMGH